GKVELRRGRAQVDARVRLDVLEDLAARFVLQDVPGVHELRAQEVPGQRGGRRDRDAARDDRGRREVKLRKEAASADAWRLHGRGLHATHLREGRGHEDESEEDEPDLAHGGIPRPLAPTPYLMGLRGTQGRSVTPRSRLRRRAPRWPRPRLGAPAGGPPCPSRWARTRSPCPCGPRR